MKLSEVTPAVMAEYVRPASELTKTEEEMWPAAVSYVLGQTGLTAEEADEYPDITIAALAVFSDFYDNRQVTVQNDKVNRVVESILGMYCKNLL